MPVVDSSQINIDPHKAALTPPVHYDTKVKAPVDIFTLEDEKPKVTRTESDTLTISADVCSEFTQLKAASNIVEGNHKLSLVYDANGHPVLFSIGTDHRLFCTWHVEGGQSSWKWRDITPGGSDIAKVQATAFDVLQSDDKKYVRIAASVVEDGDLKNGASFVYSCINLYLDNLGDEKQPTWHKANNNLGARHIHTMRLAPPPTDDIATSQFVVVGTVARGEKMASNYKVSLETSEEKPWTELSLPTDRSIIIDIAPGQMQGSLETGVFSLYLVYDEGEKRPEGTEEGKVVRYKPFVNDDLSLAPDLSKIGGTARSITTCINAAGYTDLFVAGSKGIGYWQSSAITGHPKDILLPGVYIDQVIAHEQDAKITLIATSRSGDLYVLEADRPNPNPQPVHGRKPRRPLIFPPVWYSSGVPIRKDVRLMATQRNARLDCSQLLYLASDRGLKHLIKDPSTGLWNERTITIPSTDKFTKTAAFVSQITLTDSGGTVIPSGYAVDISSSEITFATINNCTHELSSEPISVMTTSNGQVRIVLEAASNLSAPTLTLHLKSKGITEAINIDPTQRILRKLLSVTSSSQISNAKTTSGKAVFPPGKLSEGQSKDIANTLGKMPSVVQAADSSALTRLGAGINLNLSVDKKGTIGDVEAQNEDKEEVGWIDKVFQVVGDVLEGALRGIIRVLKVVWELVEDGVLFILTIAGKVFKFVCKVVGPVLRVFATFLKELTGIDLTGLIDWLGVIFDGENILKTQKVLVDFTTNGVNLYAQALTDNKAYFKYIFKSIKDAIPIPNHLPPRQDENKSKGVLSTVKEIFGKIYDAIFNNPIMHGLMGLFNRLINVIFEESGIQIPSLGPLAAVFTDAMSRLGSEEAAIFERLIDGFAKTAMAMLNGTMSMADGLKHMLSDVLWTVIDSVEAILFSVIDLVGPFFKALMNFLNEEWRLPIITKLWEFITDTKLTVMNVLTYPVAFILNIISATINSNKLPFDVWKDPTDKLPTAKSLIAEVPQDPDATFRMRGGMAETTQTEKTQKETEFEKLQRHRQTDAICGILCSLLGVAVNIFEYNNIKQSKDIEKPVKAAEVRLQELGGNRETLGPLYQIIADGETTVLKGELRKATDLLSAFLFIVRATVTIANVVSSVNTINAPLDPDIKAAVVSMKLLGTTLNLAATITQLLSIVKKEPGNLAHWSTGVMAAGNMLAFFGAGVIEFGASNKEKWDNLRLANDAVIGTVSVINFLGIWIIKPENTAAPYILAAEGALCLGSAGLAIKLYCDYDSDDQATRNDSVKETGRKV
ncbi:hypothetical protein BDQ12DRAFT_675867 [Crucibulum laeve]|uniref:Uncharacterized protein n=1 Tax=Crucibulum laeve TaxID=68775 RepID=A0A5C3MHX8_9AGAR|nr:hypothetical protein BDQ12DRAFT_675867 [Crucibulum laeve]